MKLQIEKWVEETEPFIEQAKDLFEESIRCYKVGAYKSAFIMSYLAFKVTIRFRILNCDYRPENFTEEIWKNRIKIDLEDDDKWEDQVNQIIIANPDKKDNKYIIHFGNKEREQIITEYNYWRNIRNTCVHAKHRKIDLSTVECFWNYIQDNLCKFYVLGGKDYLLDALWDYNKYITIDNSALKLERLLYDIKSVYDKDTDKFFKDFTDKFFKTYHQLIDEKNSEFWKSILFCKHLEIQTGLIKAILDNKYYFQRFYIFIPEVFNLTIQYDSKFIIDKLSIWLSDSLFQYEHSDYFVKLLCKVLERHKSEINIDIIVKNEYNMRLILSSRLDDEKIEILRRNDIFNKFIDDYAQWFFVVDANSQYNNFSSDEKIVVKCFDYIYWNKDMVSKINSKFIELEDSIRMRRNVNSIINGEKIKEAFEKIILSNKDKISDCILEINEDIENYNGIFKVISERL